MERDNEDPVSAMEHERLHYETLSKSERKRIARTMNDSIPTTPKPPKSKFRIPISLGSVRAKEYVRKTLRKRTTLSF